MLQRVMSRFSIFCRNFFVSQSRKYLQVNPSVLCFRKFPVPKKFMDERGGGGVGVEFQDFPSKNFCLTVPKISVEESFTVAIISGIEKVWIRGGGSITIFRRSFCLTVPKYFIGEHFGVSEKFFYRKFSCIEGGGITVLSELFVSQERNEKLCKGTLLFSGNFLVSKKFMDKRCHITIFSRNFYFSQCRKLL